MIKFHLTTNNFKIKIKIKFMHILAVAQLVEQSLSTPVIRGSNLVIGKICILNCTSKLIIMLRIVFLLKFALKFPSKEQGNVKQSLSHAFDASNVKSDTLLFVISVTKLGHF